MTYCNQPQWPSAYTYEGIRTEQHGENPSDTGPMVAAAPLSTLLLHRGEIAAVLPRSFAQMKPVLPGTPVPTLSRKDVPEVVVVNAAGDKAPAVPAPALAKQPVAVLGSRTPLRPDLVKPALLAPPPVLRAIELAQAPPTPTTRLVPAPAVKVGPYVSVVASVNLTKQTAKITHVMRVERAAVPATPSDRRATIVIKNAGDKIIGEYPVTLQEDTDVTAGEDRTAVIDAVIPYLPQTASLEVKLGTKVIDTRKVSKQSPTVKLPALQAHNLADTKGKSVPGMLLTWTGNHPENIPLTYTVQARAKNGTWETIAVGHTEPQLVLTPEQLARYRGGEIQVIANDGFNTSPPVKLAVPAASAP